MKKYVSDFRDLSFVYHFVILALSGVRGSGPIRWFSTQWICWKKIETWNETLKKEVNQWLLQIMSKCMEKW